MMGILQQQPPRGELRTNEPMARHTTWRVGGPADRFYQPVDRDDLGAFLAVQDPAETLYWCGFGSNVLVLDGGLRGTVIMLHPGLSRLELDGDTRIWADCGVACAKVARFAARSGLVGAEFLAGIPGTMGGALAMNAGAWGGETWGRVAWVETVDRQGLNHRRTRDDFSIGYRTVQGRDNEWFTGVMLTLEAGDGEAGLREIRDLLARRAASQPVGKPSCGSVFRNPPGDHAARLIEAAGLKDAREGGAHVSAKHANFIINDGSATARDILILAERVRDVVERTAGVRLEPEFRVIGEDSGIMKERV